MNQLFNFFQNNWIVLAFFAPMFWSLTNIIEVYFIGNFYNDELDAVIISSLFQIIALPFIIFFSKVEFNNIFFNSLVQNINVILLSFVSGIFYALAAYFAFKALFRKNDASTLQILWNLNIIIIPILSFLLFKETLPFIKYLGMMIVLSGATLLSFNENLKKIFSKKYLLVVFGSVFFLSLSMILDGKAYDSLADIYGKQGFGIGLGFFILGGSAAGVIFSFLYKRAPFFIIKKYYKIFILMETINFIGNLCSQRSINLAPTSSYVATVESFDPFFLMVYSLLILLFLKIFSIKKNEIINKIYSEQIRGGWLKFFATVIMAVGIYIIS